MTTVVVEIGIIMLLLAANGIFAMAEIAVVSARKPRLRMMADAGNRKAARALSLAESPNRFLSTVQVGITLVGIIAGAYGGASLSEKLAVFFKTIPLLADYATPVAFIVVVLCITYASLIFGELVPKRVGLTNPEKIACLLAGPMMGLSYAAKPLVNLLTGSTDALLRLIGLKDRAEAAVSKEELRLLAREGLRVGSVQPVESEMVESVLALDHLRARDLMTPRAKIIWVQEDEAHERLWHKIVVSAHTAFPVYSTTRDQMAGIITVKAIYANLAAGLPVRVKDLMTQPLVVPASQNALTLLETFKRTGRHLAMVADEFGTVVGLVTLHDIMEAIVGEFPTQDKRLQPMAKQRGDGSWLVDAIMPIEDFAAIVSDFPLDAAEARTYETFGGFILTKLGHLPTEGESFVCGDYLVEVIDMDNLRVDKVLLFRNKPTTGASHQLPAN